MSLPHLIKLLLAERIGADDLQTVPFGQRSPRAASRVLDDSVSEFESTIRLRPRQYGQRHPIFDAAGGVLPLERHEHIRTV